MIETVRSLIDAKGGNAVVARATGIEPNRVNLWVHRQKLPRSAWPEVMKAFPDVTLDRLLAIEAGAANDILPQSKAA